MNRRAKGTAKGSAYAEPFEPLPRVLDGGGFRELVGVQVLPGEVHADAVPRFATHGIAGEPVIGCHRRVNLEVGSANLLDCPELLTICGHDRRALAKVLVHSILPEK